MLQDERFSDLLPTPTREDLYFLDNEVRELGTYLRRNDLVVYAGAPIMAWWGFCSGLAGIYNFFLQMDLVPHFPVFLINAVGGYAGSFVISLFTNKSKILTQNFQAVSAIWCGVLIVMPVMIFGMAFRHADDSIIVCGLQCLLFAIATWATAVGSSSRWLQWPALGWLLTALLMFFAMTDHWRPLVFAFACFGLMTVPGVMAGLAGRRIAE